DVQQQLLTDNQSLIEYFVGDSSIFVFLVQKDNFEVHEIKKDFPLEEWVQEMTKEGIYGYYTLSRAERNATLQDNTIINYTNAAQGLYEKLLAPFEDKLTKDLIIIPDGVLGYVPFEALLTAAPPREGAFRAYPYLIKKYQISYCYSATLLQEMKQKQHQQTPTESLLAMAPFYQGDVHEMVARIDTSELLALRDSLAALPASGEEVAAIVKILDGTPSYGSAASLQQFEQLAANYRILHLSTHGKADDRVGDYAYLAFGVPDEAGTFDRLYARDLYNYSLNADMVVLSACETGIGKLQRGEGIISLARAFAYAGAKSIFTTLWQVSDEKTKDLMVYFYKNLKKGKTKDEALRNAKLEYLEKNEREAIHPFFWAGLIGIGDMSPVAQ
ncbi:MAG: CHAT domain-containing protein, partial [Saprospiraceae bacterium]